ATAKLDRLVFNPDQSVSALTVSARAGAVRWISGESRPSAYQIETTTLTLRVHGTEFDLYVEPQRTTVLLREGIVEACLIDAPQRCKALWRRGEMITATRNAIEGPQLGGLGSSDFEDRCLSAAGTGCVIGISVNPPPGPSQKPGVGQKRAEPRAPSNTPKQAYDPPQPPTSVAVVDPPPAPPLVIPIVSPPTGGDYPPPPPGVGPPPNGPCKGRACPPPPPGAGPPPNGPCKGRECPTPPPGAGPPPKPWPGKPGKGRPPPSTDTGPPTPKAGSGKGKGSAGIYKNNPQMRGSIGDKPRLPVNRNVAMAHASVGSVKPATPAIASGLGPRATSMVPRQSFT